MKSQTAIASPMVYDWIVTLGCYRAPSPSTETRHPIMPTPKRLEDMSNDFSITTSPNFYGAAREGRLVMLTRRFVKTLVLFLPCLPPDILANAMFVDPEWLPCAIAVQENQGLA